LGRSSRGLLSSPSRPRHRPARALTAGRRRRRSGLGALVLVLVLVAGVAVGVAALRGEDVGASNGRAARPAVEHLTTPVTDRPPAAAPPAVGKLPAPAGAAHVDLSRPALLSTLHLHPAPAAGLAFDLDDGSVLWRQGATRVRPIASLTKLMTALLAIESFTPRSLVRITPAADQVPETHMGGLQPGRRVRAEVLLKGLMIASGNDAAVALAIGGAGSVKAWVARMNARARLLGLTCTHYVDPDGLDPRNRSCPRDIAALAMRVMADPFLRWIANHAAERVWTGYGKKITLHTTNHLLRDHYPGAIGLKTGFTFRAGHCLVAIIKRGSRRIGIVLLGSKVDAFVDARKVARAAALAGAIAPA
jgi:D-alanyl-D-alanine carboxypeptidase (penicillin-binding protein 5/6)